MTRTAYIAWILIACLTAAAPAQDTPASRPPDKPADAEATPPVKNTTEQAAPEKLTDAERIIRLQRSIDDNEKRKADLESTLQDPESEYNKAEAEFKKIDSDLEAKKKELNKLREQGKTTEADARETDLSDLQQRWTLAKNRFDLAFQERKTLREQIDTLATKIAQDRDTLNKLQSPVATQPAAPPPPTTTPAEPGAAPSTTTAAPVTPGTAQTPPAAQGTQAQTAAPAETPPAPAVQTPTAAPETGQPAPGAAPVKPLSPEEQAAQQKAQAKEQEALEAQETVTDLESKIEQLRKLIDQDRERLKLSRQKVENSSEEQRLLQEEVQKLQSENAPLSKLTERWNKIAEARQRQRDARAEVTTLTDEIDKYQDELEHRQQEYIEALREAEQKRSEAEKAKKEAEQVSNPFSIPNLLKWSVDHGPKVGGILVAMFVLLWLARVLERRIVVFLVGHGGPNTADERENRAKTLGGVFHNAANLVIIIGGCLMIVAELGIDIVPLVGAAGVIGLAVAFGAQNLVRDYFAGFMILLENQYGINDVIKVGDVSGLVERITLRITVLRALDGTVHFIPNGQITTVSNMTHGWSRALFEIGVAYKEDVDVVMQTLVKLGKELRADPTFRQLILDDPEMLGVDAFDDSAVVIKFFIKTRPLQQWTVKRALLRRIKKKFDEMGIEIPFPHRTIYHRYEDGPPPTQELAPESAVVKKAEAAAVRKPETAVVHKSEKAGSH